jgi:hypothetical protein
MEREELIADLVKYTVSVHEALERETDSENRPHHLGHLAMAARIFMYLNLPAAEKELSRILRIETMAYAQRIPGSVAESTRLAWERLSPSLVSYLARKS